MDRLGAVARHPPMVESISRVGCGEMAEWLKAHAWKACLPQGNVGSNPTLSAIIQPLPCADPREAIESYQVTAPCAVGPSGQNGIERSS
jgi:hypothetical protein